MNAPKRVRADGRKQLLVYFQPELIKRLKVEALDQDRPAYEIAEEAVFDWLRRPGKRNKRRAATKKLF